MSWRSLTLTKILLTLAILLSLSICGFVFATITSPDTRIIRMEQLYALFAVTFLYLYFLIPPFYHIYPQVWGRKIMLESRGTLVFMTWYFGLIHTLLVFFGQLGGFAGLPFLSSTYLLAISLSFTALLVLTLFTAVSIRMMLRKLHKKPKKIFYSLVTLVGFFLLIHALLVGTHFENLSKFIPQVFIMAFFVLAALEAIRLDEWLKKNRSLKPRFGIAFSLIIGSFLFYLLGGFIFPNAPLTVNIHSEHLKQAKTSSVALPAANEDLFAVRFEHPDTITTNTQTPLSFTVTDRSLGKPVEGYEIVSDKYMHLIITDNNLIYFNHLHPNKKGNTFSVSAVFPHDGIYHVYSEFKPENAPEQLYSFTVQVGNTKAATIPSALDTTNTKRFGNYTVTLTYPQPLSATAMTVGQTEMSFTLRHAGTNKPVTTLKPYLGSFGHMVMINQQTYTYLHVHPGTLIPPRPTDEGGPTVSFYPLGLSKPITPGIYRIFAQFNPNNTLFTADFTVKIE